jgi:hypothetical protein
MNGFSHAVGVRVPCCASVHTQWGSPANMARTVALSDRGVVTLLVCPRRRVVRTPRSCSPTVAVHSSPSTVNVMDSIRSWTGGTGLLTGRANSAYLSSTCSLPTPGMKNTATVSILVPLPASSRQQCYIASLATWRHCVECHVSVEMDGSLPLGQEPPCRNRSCRPWSRSRTGRSAPRKSRCRGWP